MSKNFSKKADAVEPKADAVEPKADAVEPSYTVAAGKALTTKVGILANGDDISPEHLHGGEGAFEAFIKSGHIVKK